MIGFVFGALLFLAGCSDVLIEKIDNFDSVHSINFKGQKSHTDFRTLIFTGEIEGELLVVFQDNGDSLILKGKKVNHKYSGDWYTPTANIQIKPLIRTSGHLTIQCLF